MKLFLIFCLFIFGCSGVSFYQYHRNEAELTNRHEEIYPIYLDNDFSLQEVDSIVSAANEWNFVLNGYMKLVIDRQYTDHRNEADLLKIMSRISESHEGLLILGMNHGESLVKKYIEDDEGTLAFVNGLGKRGHLMVIIQDRIGSRDLHSIVLHEFGHAMGAGHVYARSLMFPVVGKNQLDCIDKITAAQVAWYHDYSLNHMNYCTMPDFE